MMPKVIKNQEVIFKGNTEDCLDFISNTQHSALSMVLVLNDTKEQEPMEVNGD